MTRLQALLAPVGSALVTLLISSCGEGEEIASPTPEATPTPSASPTRAPTPSLTPIPSPTEPPEVGDIEGFRAFAARIAAAVEAEDALFFSERGVEDEVACAGDEVLGFCEGQPAGAVFRGIPGGVVQSDAFALFSPEEYESMLAEWFGLAQSALDDEYGSGTVTVYAIAYHPANAFEDEAYQAILTGIFSDGAEPEREARILSFRFIDETWRLTAELYATRELTAGPYSTGDCCPDLWERWEE